VVVESLFAWQGLGHALVHAVFWRDVPVLQATAIALALLVVAVNTTVDLAVRWLDPRPRRQGVLG
jgi:peptide/nickel transport system permease protein